MGRLFCNIASIMLVAIVAVTVPVASKYVPETPKLIYMQMSSVNA